MNQRNMIYVFVMFFMSFNAYSELKCSQNGTKFIFINGVNVNEKVSVKATSQKIDNILYPKKSQIDKNGIIHSVISFHNESKKVLNDVYELKSLMGMIYQGQKKGEFWKAQAKEELDLMADKNLDPALENMVKEGFDQIYGQKFSRNLKDKEFDQNYFSKVNLYLFLKEFNVRLANILENAAMEEEVVEGLKAKILKENDNGKYKVILISHSQGNAVASEALRRINSQLPYLSVGYYRYSWLTSTFGNVRVASPAPVPLYTGFRNYRDITLNADAVIGNSFIATGIWPSTANYILDESIPLSKNVNAFLALGSLNYAEAIYHSMDDIYLSEKYSASRVSPPLTTEPTTMADHFRNNVIEVAGQLGNNCKVTLTPEKALCEVHGDGPEGTRYFSYFGTAYSLAFKFENKEQSIYVDSGNDCGLGGISGIVTHPDLYWCGIPLNAQKTSYHMKFETIGGDVHDFTVPHPCIKDMSLPEGGVINI